MQVMLAVKRNFVTLLNKKAVRVRHSCFSMTCVALPKNHGSEVHTPSYADVTQRVRRCVWAIAILIGALIGSMSQAQSPAAPSPEGKGPTTSITTAKLIAEGTTLSGSLVPGQDRHFFQFKASSTKTRVILRKRSKGGFQGAVDIYDHNEKGVAEVHEGVSLLPGIHPQNQPITLSFESHPGELYYIVVTVLESNTRGDYELTVRKE
jgi:hypothetical protein